MSAVDSDHVDDSHIDERILGNPKLEEQVQRVRRILKDVVGKAYPRENR